MLNISPNNGICHFCLRINEIVLSLKVQWHCIKWEVGNGFSAATTVEACSSSARYYNPSYVTMSRASNCVFFLIFIFFINPRMLPVFCEIFYWFFDNFNAITLFLKKKKGEKSIKTHFYILKCVQPICPILKSTILFRRFQKNWKTNMRFFYKWFLACSGERCAECGWWAVAGLLSFSISIAIAWT